MKFYRKLTFHKRWIDTGNDLYKIVSDAGITSFILVKTNYYGLKLIKIELSDYSNCLIEVFGDKESFLCFVRDFINTYENHLKDISF